MRRRLRILEFTALAVLLFAYWQRPVRPPGSGPVPTLLRYIGATYRLDTEEAHAYLSAADRAACPLADYAARFKGLERRRLLFLVDAGARDVTYRVQRTEIHKTTAIIDIAFSAEDFLGDISRRADGAVRFVLRALDPSLPRPDAEGGEAPAFGPRVKLYRLVREPRGWRVVLGLRPPHKEKDGRTAPCAAPAGEDPFQVAKK